MKIVIVTPDSIEEKDMTAEEISAKEAIDASDKIAIDEAEANRLAKEDTKASARQKLIDGEPLTEEEAKTVVI